MAVGKGAIADGRLLLLVDISCQKLLELGSTPLPYARFKDVPVQVPPPPPPKVKG